MEREDLFLPHPDLESWKKKHPRSSKWHPDFYVDFNENGSTERSPYAWSAVRSLVLERDGFKCRVCGSNGWSCRKLQKEYKEFKWYTNGLEVQHIIPKKDGGSDHPKNLITLCYDCHKKTFRFGYRGIPGMIPEELDKFIQTTLSFCT